MEQNSSSRRSPLRSDGVNGTNYRDRFEVEVADAYGETMREIAGQLSDDELRLLTSAARVMREGSARLRAAKEDSGAENGG